MCLATHANETGEESKSLCNSKKLQNEKVTNDRKKDGVMIKKLQSKENASEPLIISQLKVTRADIICMCWDKKEHIKFH